MSSNKYYTKINLIRVISCILVLLYHLNILKGGYLAVCTFLVLSGYLLCVSALKKEKFSFKEYYLNKLLKIYLPLLLVVFITIAIVFLLNKEWLNLKPETTSILFGYNNFWQLSANLDYFSRHLTSPFIHLWYISILLQFNLIFPFIFVILKKIGNRFNKIIPCIITIILSIIGSIYFYKMSLHENIMITYYSTLSRIFPLFFGISLGFINIYYNDLIFNKLKKINQIIFYIYLLLLILLCIFIGEDSNYFAISMIIISLITCRLIAYGTVNNEKTYSSINKVINYLSKISYEIYLVQYPVIFFVQDISINDNFKKILIIIIVLLISIILNFSIDFNKKNNVLKRIMFGCIFGISLFGVYKYIITEDYTNEMKKLEQQLELNKNIIEEKQKEYLKQLENENNEWNSTLKELQNGEEDIKNVVSNLHLTGVGDSVMLGAVSNLYDKFPNGYFDAAISRTAWVANEILKDLKNKNVLGDPIILNLGANGDCSFSCKKEIMETIGDRKVFWLTVTNNSEVNVNESLLDLSLKYPNLYIIDWNEISKGHLEYFFADKIHLTPVGRNAYTSAIYNEIYNVYLEEYKSKKDEIIKEHEEQEKNKITFYGNDLLLNVFDYIKEDFSQAKIVIDNNFNFKNLKTEIEKSKINNTFTHKIVFVFDNSSTLNSLDYYNLIEYCSSNEIYIVSFNRSLNINNENVTIIDFSKEVELHTEYLLADKIHLSEEGNIALKNILIEKIYNKKFKNNFS